MNSINMASDIRTLDISFEDGVLSELFDRGINHVILGKKEGECSSDSLRVIIPERFFASRKVVDRHHAISLLSNSLSLVSASTDRDSPGKKREVKEDKPEDKPEDSLRVDVLHSIPLTSPPSPSGSSGVEDLSSVGEKSEST